MLKETQVLVLHSAIQETLFGSLSASLLEELFMVIVLLCCGFKATIWGDNLL